jgi:hypothetical protein
MMFSERHYSSVCSGEFDDNFLGAALKPISFSNLLLLREFGTQPLAYQSMVYICSMFICGTNKVVDRRSSDGP